ncbi:PF07600 family protein [Leptospira borgpetersenii serovar Hardjo-bovis str. Sponselee]|uniref:PF07600 family protein n=1 Tax=Leptospira borgpetersenii serovar Hardjo-bovis str. Sponselee TaxID=1303729 RepID=M6BR84_LEPBO|nr:PF07600 family protein [Leptospira borgpetersenii serovar Hardjo-bovis str. Sponselee]
MKTVLHFLLKRNRNRLHSIFAYSENEKTLYQKTELELVRFSFRPDSADWAELRLAARYYGVSICNFFVMLLVFDENESVGKILATKKLRIRKFFLFNKFSQRGNLSFFQFQ